MKKWRFRQRRPPAPKFYTGQELARHLTVLLVAGAILPRSIVSPPSLMDDVDAVQAQIARTC